MFDSRRYLLLAYGRKAVVLVCVAAVLLVGLSLLALIRWGQPTNNVVGVVESIGYNPGAEEASQSSQLVVVRVPSGMALPLAFPRGCRSFRVGDTVNLLERHYRFFRSPAYRVIC